MNAITQDPDRLRQRLRGWIEENLPHHMRLDHPDYRPASIEELTEWERRCYHAGLWGVTWPKEYGGHALTIREHLVANEEVGRVAMPASVNSVAKELVGPILLSAGSERQRETLLRPILEMEHVWCQGFSEPEAGSDLARLRTRAERIDGGWRINGQKIWTSYAARADYCLLLARTGTVEDRHKGLVLFAVQMDLPGIEARPIPQMTELDGFCETFFTDVEIPEDAVIGSVDGGWRAAVSVLSVERATNRMYRGCRFENELVHLIRTCRSDPSLAPLLDDAGFCQRIGALWTDMEVIKANARDVVERIALGHEVGEYGSFIKLHWSEAHQRLAVLGLEMMAQSWRSDAPAVARARARFEEIYLEGRCETIYAGTTEIQLGIIADRILGLPRVKQ